MKVAAFLTSTIAGTLVVLFGTYGVGQLVPATPVPAVLAGLGLLLVIGALIWRGFRRSLSASGLGHNDPSPLFWTPAARKLVGSKFLLIGAILGAGLAVGVIAFALTGATAPAPEALESLSFHLQMVFVVAGLTAVIVTFPLNSALTEEQRRAAVRMAVLVPVILPLQKFGLFYLYGYFATAFMGTLLAGEGRFMPTALLVFMGAVVVIYLPYLAQQVRRASHYARTNAALRAG